VSRGSMGRGSVRVRSRFTILLTWSCRIRITFLRRCSARFTRLMTMPRKDACNRVVGGDHRAATEWDQGRLQGAFMKEALERPGR